MEQLERQALVLGCSLIQQNALILACKNRVAPGEFVPTSLDPSLSISLLLEGGKQVTLGIAASHQIKEDHKLKQIAAASHVFILLVSVKEPESVKAAKEIWTKELKQFDRVPILIVGVDAEVRDTGESKNDGDEDIRQGRSASGELQNAWKNRGQGKDENNKDIGSPVVPIEDMLAFSKQIDALSYMEASVKNMQNVLEVFENAGRMTIGQIKKDTSNSDDSILEVLRSSLAKYPKLMKIIESKSPIEQYGHDKSITDLSLHGNFLYTSGLDCTVKIWKSDAGILLRTLQHENPVHSVVGYDQFIASVQDNGTVVVWHINRVDPLYSMKMEGPFKSGSIFKLHTPQKKTIETEMGMTDPNAKGCNPMFFVLSNNSSPYIYRFKFPEDPDRISSELEYSSWMSQIPFSFSFLPAKIFQGLYNVSNLDIFYVPKATVASANDLVIILVGYNNGDIIAFDGVTGEILQYFPGTSKKWRWTPCDQPWFKPPANLDENTLKNRKLRLVNSSTFEQQIYRSLSIKQMDLIVAGEVKSVAADKQKISEMKLARSRTISTENDTAGIGDSNKSKPSNEAGDRPGSIKGKESISAKGASSDSRFFMVVRCDGLNVTIFNFSTGEILKVIQHFVNGFASPFEVMRNIQDSENLHIFATTRKNSNDSVIHFLEPFCEIKRLASIKPSNGSVKPKSLEGLNVYLNIVEDVPVVRSAGGAFMKPSQFQLPFPVTNFDVSFLSQKHDDEEEELILVGSDSSGNYVVRYVSHLGGAVGDASNGESDKSTEEFLKGNMHVFSALSSNQIPKLSKIYGNQLFIVPQPKAISKNSESYETAKSASSFNLLMRKEKAQFSSIIWLSSLLGWFQILKDHAELLSLSFNSQYGWPQSSFITFVKFFSLNLKLSFGLFINKTSFWIIILLVLLFNAGYVFLGFGRLAKKFSKVANFFRVYVPLMTLIGLFATMTFAVEIFQCRYVDSVGKLVHDYGSSLGITYCFEGIHVLYFILIIFLVIPFYLFSMRIRAMNGLAGISRDHWISLNWKYDERQLCVGSFWLNTPSAAYEIFYVTTRIGLVFLVNLAKNAIGTQIIILLIASIALAVYGYLRPSFYRPAANSLNISLFCITIFTNIMAYSIFNSPNYSTRVSYSDTYIALLIPLIIVSYLIFRYFHQSEVFSVFRKSLKGMVSRFESEVMRTDTFSKNPANKFKRSTKALRDYLFVAEADEVRIEVDDSKQKKSDSRKESNEDVAGSRKDLATKPATSLNKDQVHSVEKKIGGNAEIRNSNPVLKKSESAEEKRATHSVQIDIEDPKKNLARKESTGKTLGSRKESAELSDKASRFNEDSNHHRISVEHSGNHSLKKSASAEEKTDISSRKLSDQKISFEGKNSSDHTVRKFSDKEPGPTSVQTRISIEDSNRSAVKPTVSLSSTSSMSSDSSSSNQSPIRKTSRPKHLKTSSKTVELENILEDKVHFEPPPQEELERSKPAPPPVPQSNTGGKTAAERAARLRAITGIAAPTKTASDEESSLNRSRSHSTS